MTNPQLHVEKQWTVGGYEIDHGDEAGWRQWRDIKIARKLEDEIRVALNECLAHCHELVGEDTRPGFNARLLIDEAGVNMFGHGKRGNPAKPSTIFFKAEVLDRASQQYRFLLSLHDDRPMFDVDALPDPTYDERLEEVTGRGILLIRKQCRAKIRQVPHDDGGKHMVYEWKHPEYSLSEVGFPEPESSKTLAEVTAEQE